VSRWRVIAVDAHFDSSTEYGRLVRRILRSVARAEARHRSEVSKAVVAMRRTVGFPIGRSRMIPESVTDRCRELRASGSSHRQVAAALEAEDVPTSCGGKRWYAMVARDAVLSRAA